MKATDLVKSLSLSNITSDDFEVVTLYKGQNPTVFLIDNFDDGRVTKCLQNFKPLTILESQDFLAIYINVPLVTPDGKSVFMPDCVYEVNGGGIVSLYSFN